MLGYSKLTPAILASTPTYPQAAAPRRTPLLVQNLRVNNVEIPNSKRIQVSLQYIYGIGQTTAENILRDTVRRPLTSPFLLWVAHAFATASTGCHNNHLVHLTTPSAYPPLQGVENKKTYELNEEEINKLRDEVGKYTTESDLVSRRQCCSGSSWVAWCLGNAADIQVQHLSRSCSLSQPARCAASQQQQG
jgi:hypothetical protein